MEEEMQDVSQTKMGRAKAFINECSRVLKITKKPDRVEFITIVKISALGIALIGALGFVFAMVKEIFFKGMFG